MTLRILYVNPVGSDVVDDPVKKTVEAVKGPGVEGRVVHLEEGADHLEYHLDEHENLGETLEWIKRGEDEGYDAAVIGCFYDTGLREARELVSLPVLAPAESCVHLAATLGHRFSVIVGRRKWIPKIDARIREYGVAAKLASFRSIDTSVPQMRAHPDRMWADTLQEAGKAVEEDGAEVIVLGCTGYVGFMKEAMLALSVPVLDPVVTAWKWAEMMAALHRRTGLAHCKLYGYEAPDMS